MIVGSLYSVVQCCPVTILCSILTIIIIKHIIIIIIIIIAINVGIIIIITTTIHINITNICACNLPVTFQYVDSRNI